MSRQQPFPRTTTPEALAYWRMIDQAAERVRALAERIGGTP